MTLRDEDKAAIAAYVDALLKCKPPLDEEQKRQLRALLHPQTPGMRGASRSKNGKAAA